MSTACTCCSLYDNYYSTGRAASLTPVSCCRAQVALAAAAEACRTPLQGHPLLCLAPLLLLLALPKVASQACHNQIGLWAAPAPTLPAATAAALPAALPAALARAVQHQCQPRAALGQSARPQVLSHRHPTCCARTLSRAAPLVSHTAAGRHRCCAPSCLTCHAGVSSSTPVARPQRGLLVLAGVASRAVQRVHCCDGYPMPGGNA